ncbi:DUF6542 domain-containing protein [Mycobacterium sp. C3-094]|uniref:DUF6542 domain-containing protein n=1 Tax=Mycobacterium sp. PSTR-4-N TaxID=2917745 RepID=UPI001F14D22C|nr:DUF6542 domain-containing protein [Mycobacterium sp. PSTR-4-N]MCG7597078.1 hypothetical protein [Mycobacterium sp. PSTR-4-N]
MSGQSARAAIPADLRSAHPGIAGVPWWGAILIAVAACTAGFAIDAGSGGGALTTVFSVLYVMGCLTAVLAVRRQGLFTAVIQPPLLLFVTVPGAYFLMHSSEIKGIKDLLINCGYPLIERFPLMFFTSAAVLVVGIARRYLGAAPNGHSSSVSAKLSGFVTRGTGTDDAEPADKKPKEPRRRHTAAKRTERPRDAAKARARAERPTRRAAPSRSRHARPPAPTEIIEPVVDLDRPRRRRPRPDEVPPAEPRRRPRPSSTRESRMPPGERLGGYDRPTRRPRYDDYEPRESSTHHPVSRVRYRGSDSDTHADDQEYRPRRRPSRDVGADRWEYDI